MTKKNTSSPAIAHCTLGGSAATMISKTQPIILDCDSSAGCLQWVESGHRKPSAFIGFDRAMNRSSLFVVLFVITACVSNPGASPATHRVLPTAPPDKQTGVQFIRQTTEQDLLWSAKQRFGEALVRRAFAASTYIFAKHYAGMLPPPPPNAGPDWRYPEPPVAVLIRENGRWLAATPDGFRQARSDKTADVERILADPIFWAEPE